ncbi:ArnT family glycosyltransferase [Polymorphospora rubra]|uniref:ArnT family glycosyltransferase n=1 Tax=Polymorphospora rubra TaxID=338584 RepID=UPI0033DEFCD9
MAHPDVLRPPVPAAPAARPPRPAATTIAFAVIVVVALAYRTGLVVVDIPPANSDEATAGLAALHIGQGRHWPVFFYGQHYMGTLHSYLAAPAVQFFGTQWWALRIPALAVYVVFLVLVFHLTKRLYTPWFAVFVAGLLAFGSDRVVKNQIIGAGGYSEIAAATAAVMLVAVVLAMRRATTKPLGYLLWGGLAGFIAWTHWLGLPYVAVSAALLAVLTRRELRVRAAALAAVGFLAGCAPLLWHFVFSGRNPLAVLLSVSGAEQPASWPDRIHGAVVLGLPLGSGLCAPGDCRPWQLWWGPAYLVLLGVAVFLSVHAARRAEGVRRARAAGRTALAAGGALTLAAYLVSSSAATTPIESARYLHYGLLSLPAVLWPAWRCATTLVRRGSRPAAGRSGTRVLAAGGLALLVAFTANAAVASGQLVAHRDVYARKAADERTLVAYLRDRGLHHVYSEYWTCNRLNYVTAEDVRCAVLGDDLRPGHDRYLPYRAAVGRADRVAYVLPAGGPADDRLARFADSSAHPVTVEQVAGYRVYEFAGRVDPT